jgi:predicted Zn-dependent peptidase
MLTVYAGTGADDLGDLARITMDEIKRSAGDISQAEVDRARAQMKAGMLMGLESPSSRAERLARVVGIWNRVPALEETIERINEVDVAGVRAHAEAMVSSRQAAMALYGPVEAGPSLDELTERLAA